MDSGRATEWVDLFAKDGCFEIVGQMTLQGAGQLVGIPAILAEKSGGKWRHHITDIMIDAGPSNDIAYVGASGLVTNWSDGGRAIMFANYQGALSRIDGPWRIARLTGTMLTG